ncbi:MAG: OmpA/MotB family protein [Desulfobacterales bacterium]
MNTGGFPSNWELSTFRALNVLRFFLEKAKIPPERLTAVGFGEFQPLFPNDIPQHRAGNSRVEILLASKNKN